MENKNREKYKLGSLLLRTLKDIFNVVPGAATCMLISIILKSALVGVNAFVLARLFNQAKLFLDGKDVSRQLIICCGILGIVNLLQQLTDAIFTENMVKVDSSILYKFKIELSKKCTRLPLITLEDFNRINELERAKQCLQNTRLSDLSLSFFNIMSEVISVGSVSFVLASFDPWLIPISLISVIPYIVIRMIRGTQFYELKWFQAKKQRRKDYLFKLFSDKRSMKEIRVMCSGDYLENKWGQVRDEINEEVWDFKKKDILVLCFCDFLKIVGYFLSVIIVIEFTIKGRISIGEMSACLVAFSNFQTSMKYVMINIGRIPECASFTSDFYYFMDLEEEPERKNELPPVQKGIHLGKVSFCYPNTTKPSIQDVSLDIKVGETVAILGENGSGKTTLTKIILGLYKCMKGEILFDDLNIDSIKRNSLYDYISMVSQNFTQYNLSLRENILFSNEANDETEKKIEEICEWIGLESVLQEDKLGTLLGREFGGVELSQGQWQKIAIARVLVKESQIVFLDEPTSALDPIIENEILTQFLRLVQGKTAIIISHRVGLCKNVDKIVVMKNGGITEIGNHTELMKKKGEYYRLYTAQNKWYI